MSNHDAPVFYLGEDVYFEPLFHKWYMWPYLLSPLPAALNLTGRNLRLMKSFVANAHLHVAASQVAQLAGGDFVNCSANQIDDVRRLIDEIECRHPEYLAVREAVGQLTALLEQQNGMSLEALYAQVPEVLRGLVELTYDMQHSATFRMIEGLLYQSSLYNRAAQSVSFGMLSRVAKRPFVLSSPRLPDENHLHMQLELADARLDRLLAARTHPLTMAAIDALFAGVAQEGGLPYQALFTATPPRRRHVRPQQGIRVTYLGHAGLMIETPRTAILVDPVIASRDGVHDDQLLSFSELPEHIDYICLTHAHMDHTCLETLVQLRHKTGCVLVPRNGGGELVDVSLKLMLQVLGFNVRDMEEMEQLQCADGRITALPFLGEHADLAVRAKAAWHFEFAGKRIFSGADSASLDANLYRRVQAALGDVDMLFIGMECVGAPMSWLYGALFPRPVPRAINESRRFNGSDFVSARTMVEIFHPSQVGIYALGLEPWFAYFMGLDYSQDARQIVESDKLLASCREHGIQAARLTEKRTWEFTDEGCA